ncbi:hypothetical protein Q8791_23230 [Nocardiopsis sp. CT-R113]|uniref:Uncharacterized protein n=1 Tax=Nocardiopsis codii TaxID=3065942 RepID=A0ABU7KD28_9ACTN|nr:hypothetical protein [Nocardiopsis sp. CT-R113]MEE2040135.1 hypothetical protein [Nocardiopsis sp. CT-R113]
MAPDRDQLALDIEPVNPGIADTLRVTSADWWSRASRAVAQLAREGRPFQAYDVVTRFGVEEPDNGAKQWGALFSAMRKAGVIVHHGYTTSARPTANSSACRQWIGAATPIPSTPERPAA